MLTELELDLQIEAVAGAMGSEVRGIDLREPLAEAQVTSLRELVNDRLALFFPDQFLSHEEHRRFVAQFGQLERHPETTPAIDGTDHEVAMVNSERAIADVWHMDYDYTGELSPSGFGSMNMIECPEQGGDTMWSNQYLLYESLSPPCATSSTA